jgi:hypothetical protein
MKGTSSFNAPRNNTAFGKEEFIKECMEQCREYI